MSPWPRRRTTRRDQIPYSEGSSSSERGRDDPLLLCLVCGGIAFGRTRALGPGYVEQRHALREQVANFGHHELARAHIARLFLHPHDFLEVGIAARVFADLGPGERVQQLDPSDLDVWRFGAAG